MIEMIAGPTKSGTLYAPPSTRMNAAPLVLVPGNDGNEESVLSGGTPPAASSQLALPPRLRISCARAMAAPCLPFLWNAAGSRETPNTPMMLSIMVDWTEGSAHHRALPNSTCTAIRFLLGNGDMERDDVA